jgi:hypothetical protein
MLLLTAAQTSTAFFERKAHKWVPRMKLLFNYNKEGLRRSMPWRMLLIFDVQQGGFPIPTRLPQRAQLHSNPILCIWSQVPEEVDHGLKALALLLL